MLSEDSRYYIEGQPEMKKLFGHCFEIARIKNGDNLPVGGIFDRLTTFVTADLSFFADFFTQLADKSAQKREFFYRSLGDKKLSQVFKGGFAQCAEIAALAQVFYKKKEFLLFSELVTALIFIQKEILYDL